MSLRSFKRVNTRGRKPRGNKDEGSGYNCLGGERVTPAVRNQDDASNGMGRTLAPKHKTRG